MAQLAIKGHATRGEEVIEILEMLGGKNDNLCYGGFIGRIYFINENGYIAGCDKMHKPDYLQLTLEEFLEKFPYKIGDKVIAYIEGCLAQFTIQDMRWNYELNKVEYKICSSWLDTSVILPCKEETIDKANKAVFDANAQCCDIMNHLIKKETMEEIKIDIPKGYEFAGVDDKQQMVFTKIRYHYPKTYEECYDILGLLKPENDDSNIFGYRTPLLSKFQKLLVCRDAYWKIAGEQMGLDKPWEPDYNEESYEQGSPIKHVIYYTGTYITKGQKCTPSYILAFPTAEMRDAFKVNFDDDIEFCKEFL